MINISETIKDWPVVNGWSISPGVEWCDKGARIRAGFGCAAGYGLRVGDWFRVGDGFSVGDRFKAGNRFTAGNRFIVGNNFTVGDGFAGGDSFKAGDDATGIANIGLADGYAKSISSVGGVAYIGAGCRWFTLRDALEHWGNHEEDRRMTMCLLESAKAIAALHRLRPY